MIGLEVNLDGLIPILIGIMTGPAILFFIIGAILSNKGKKKAAKVLFILGVVYLVISFGSCGLMMS